MAHTTETKTKHRPLLRPLAYRLLALVRAMNILKRASILLPSITACSGDLNALFSGSPRSLSAWGAHTIEKK